MVRNFTISKGLPCRPGRVWRKNTGEPSLRLICQATMRITGESSSRPKAEASMSKMRFTIRHLILCDKREFESAQCQGGCNLIAQTPANRAKRDSPHAPERTPLQPPDSVFHGNDKPH